MFSTVESPVSLFRGESTKARGKSHDSSHFQYFVCCKFLGDDSDLYRQHFLSFCALAALLAALVSTGFGLFIGFQ